MFRFGTNGVSLSGFSFAFKTSFPQYLIISQMFSSGGIFVLLNVLVDVTTHVAEIICITQIPFEFMNNILTNSFNY